MITNLRVIKRVLTPKLFSLALIAALTSCESSTHETETYKVNEENSTVEWKGSAKAHFHTGSFDVKGDFVSDDNGNIKSGKFIIPIASIKNFDLMEDETTMNMLLNHLKSSDFFNMALYPNAEFEFHKIETYKNDIEGAKEGANSKLTGYLTMLGNKHLISFPARINANNSNMTVEAIFTIDKSKWGMTYANDPNKDLYIYPEVELNLKLTANKTQIN